LQEPELQAGEDAVHASQRAVPSQRAEAQRAEAGEEAADKIRRKRSQTKTNGGGLKRIKC